MRPMPLCHCDLCSARPPTPTGDLTARSPELQPVGSDEFVADPAAHLGRILLDGRSLSLVHSDGRAFAAVVPIAELRRLLGFRDALRHLVDQAR